jgi:hypothetical protein
MGASRRGPEPWNTEAEESTALGAAAKQREREHWSVCNSDL